MCEQKYGDRKVAEQVDRATKSTPSGVTLLHFFSYKVHRKKRNVKMDFPSWLGQFIRLICITIAIMLIIVFCIYRRQLSTIVSTEHYLGVVISAATVLVWLMYTFRTYHQVEDKEYARYAIGDVRQTIRNTHFESTTGSTPSIAR